MGRSASRRATARRDLAALAAQNRVVRTYGGALTEFAQRFPSFREREREHAPAKGRIAAAAHGHIQPGTTCYLDSGTTIFALAGELRRRPVSGLRIVTNNLPVAELLSACAPDMRVCLLGGELLARQSVLVGPVARKALRFHPIDQAFLSAEGADAAGVWNSQAEVSGLQQKVLAQASESVLCLDASKFGRTAPAFLAAWEKFDLLITDAPAARLRGLPTCRRELVGLFSLTLSPLLADAPLPLIIPPATSPATSARKAAGSCSARWPTAVSRWRRSIASPTARCASWEPCAGTCCASSTN